MNKTLSKILLYPAEIFLREYHFYLSRTNTTKLLKSLGINPTQLFDIGANNSQEAKHWIKHFPIVEVHSFEPNQQCHPIGTWYKVALGSEKGEGLLAGNNASMYVSTVGHSKTKIERFQDFQFNISSNAMLKVDCENMTTKVLIGMGRDLQKFRVAHIELWNYGHWDGFENQVSAIHALMHKCGFHNCQIVDSMGWLKNTNYVDVVFWK